MDRRKGEGKGERGIDGGKDGEGMERGEVKGKGEGEGYGGIPVKVERHNLNIFSTGTV